MNRELQKLARDFALWIADQDENIVELPPEGVLEKKETMQRPSNKELLEKLRQEVLSCRKCGLGQYRLNAVFGVGNPDARLMFVGEGPGFQEDHQGEPFVGRSGQLLDKIMETVLGLKRSDVYIANIVKCHPMKNPETPEAHSNDRPPSPMETNECKDYLEEQIRIIQPVCIVPLGSVAAKFLLKSTEGISVLRGKEYEYDISGMPEIRHRIKIVPTYHPAALLRNPNLKRDTWYDIKLVKAILDSDGR